VGGWGGEVCYLLWVEITEGVSKGVTLALSILCPRRVALRSWTFLQLAGQYLWGHDAHKATA
jgi:hypothetical protein